MQRLKPCLLSSALLIAALPPLTADQPIMNMMPRWNGGYGVQMLADTIHRSDLKQGKDVVGDGFSEDISQVHLQGVYTWHRSIRLTFKLPYVIDARRELLDTNGDKIVQQDQGLGDLTVALPLKHYFNLATRSGNWTVAPQLRVPLGRKDSSYQVADRVWGTGISVGYETETYYLFLATSASAWVFENPKPAEWSWSLDIGWNARDNMQLLWESDFKWDADHAMSLSAGPALYWRWNDHTHIRIEWKHDFISDVNRHAPDHGNGDRLSGGIGFVF